MFTEPEKRPGSYLIVGGAKSGKSCYAQALAESYPAPRLFIATAEPFDEEMKEKIKIHKSQRGESWETIEEPLEIEKTIRENGNKFPVILLDCITLWISNLILRKDLTVSDFKARLRDLKLAIRDASATVIVVSNEVGMGIVPESAVSRKFREFAGLANQQLAMVSDKVVLCVAGLAIFLKK